MGGKFSREKGRRNEQQLVLYLASRHYTAERVLRQYQASGLPDVIATKAGRSYSFEMKARKDSFKRIYELYYRMRDPDKAIRFTIGPLGPMVAMSTELESIVDEENNNKTFREVVLDATGPGLKDLKVYIRIAGLVSLKQTADFLVIKDNCQPRIFMRFW